MIKTLVVLSNISPGIRDLYWIEDKYDPAVAGYNVYRSQDTPIPGNWKRINPDVVNGKVYRDQTSLLAKTYTILESDWVEDGEFGRQILKLPDSPIYSDITAGQARIAASIDSVKVTVDGIVIQPASVDGFAGQVWLPQNGIVLEDGSVSVKRNVRVTKASSIVVEYKTLFNFVNPWLSSGRTFYTVVPVDANGNELHAPGAPGTQISDIMQIEKMDYIFAEAVRRNAFLFEVAGEPAWLMIRKSTGKLCGCVKDGQARTGCPSCYETRYVGGYYGPIDINFIDPDQDVVYTVREGGRTVERPSRSMLGPTPLVSNGDMIVRFNGERLIIGGVTYKSPKGILVQQEFDVELLNPGDTRYQIEIPNPTVVYHPAFEQGNAPVSDPAKDPTKVVLNDQLPAGRTITFGNIMST